MTFAEMRREAELLYESINSSDAPGFTDTEWGYILTIAQRKVVRRILNEGINRNAFNQLAIEFLVREDSYSAFALDTHFKNTDGSPARRLNITPPVGKEFDPTYFWILDEYATTSANSNIPLMKISYDFYRKNIENPFRTPNSIDGFWVLQYDNTPVFITDGTLISGYYIVGVQHPDNYPISIAHNCELNEGVHSDIVQEAVTLARMSVTDPQGYQLSMTEFNKP
jgi:hypothetical protein